MVDLCLCCVMNYVLGDEWFEQTKNAQETCNSQHIWDSQKAVVSSKTILELFCGGDVEIEEKRRETENKHLPPTHRDAIYLRKKQVVLRSSVFVPEVRVRVTSPPRRGEAPASDAIITIIDINIAHAFCYYNRRRSVST